MNKYHYVLLVLLTLYLIVMYHSALPVLLFLLELLLPALLYGLLIPAAGGLQMHFGGAEQVYEAGERIPVTLFVRNSTFLPIVHLHLELCIRNQLTGEAEQLTLSAMLPARGTIKLPMSVSSRYCGQMQIVVERVYLWDFLRMFRKKKNITVQTSFLIVPSLAPVSVEVRQQIRTFFTDSDQYDPYEKGCDPSEVFQIRDYQPGDRMQQIHWKLSAARDRLLVKELSKPLQHPVVVLMSMHTMEPWVLQQMVTGLFSLCWFMLQQACPSELICRTPEGTLQKLSFTEEEDVMPCMETVFSGMALEEDGLFLHVCETWDPSARYAHCIYLTDTAEEALFQQMAVSPLAERYTVVWFAENPANGLQELAQVYGIDLVTEREGEETMLHRHWVI